MPLRKRRRFGNRSATDIGIRFCSVVVSIVYNSQHGARLFSECTPLALRCHAAEDASVGTRQSPQPCEFSGAGRPQEQKVSDWPADRGRSRSRELTRLVPRRVTQVVLQILRLPCRPGGFSLASLGILAFILRAPARSWDACPEHSTLGQQTTRHL